MKILMVGPDRNAMGGISTVIRNMFEYKNPSDIILMNNWQKNNRKRLFIKNFFSIGRMIQKNKIDIVHFHVAQKGSFYRKSLLLLRVPKSAKTVFHIHASSFDDFYETANPIKKRLIRRILDKADLIVAVSESWRDYYSKLTDTKVTYINNAVQPPTEINYNVDSKNIVTLGRIGARKGSYDLLKVAKLVYETQPEIQFYLYGDGEIEKLKEQSKSLPNVHIRGWIGNREKSRQFQDTAMHILPSYHEGLPMAILETMSAGIPNLSTTVGGIPIVIKTNRNGFLTEPGNISEMANHILNYMTSDRLTKEKISRNAVETIKDNFSLDIYMNRWTTLYHALLADEE